jgi:GTP-binding protein HflX
VWNKIDQVAPEVREELRNDAARGDRTRILVSAVTGEGIPDLIAAIDARLGAGDSVVDVTVAPDQGRLLSWIHANAHVLAQSSDDDGRINIQLRIAAEKSGQLERQIKLAARKTAADAR